MALVRVRTSTHPGEILAEELLARKISVESFSKKIKISPTLARDILSKKARVTKDLAKKIARFIGNDQGFWNRLQREYDESFVRHPFK